MAAPAMTATPNSEPSCPECGGSGFFRLDAPVGSKEFGRVVPCDHPSHAETRLSRLSGLSNLLPNEATKRIKDIKPNGANTELLKAAKEMIDDPLGRWLYIYGKAGNAKSDILLAIVNEVNTRGGGPAMLVEFSRLLNWITEANAEKDYRAKSLKSGIGPADWANEGYIDRLERIATIRILAIDEFDKVRMTDFREEFLFEFLNLRWRQAVAGTTATLFASQTAPIDWPDPIRSRIEDGRFRVVHNLAGDARRAMKRGG